MVNRVSSSFRHVLSAVDDVRFSRCRFGVLRAFLVSIKPVCFYLHSVQNRFYILFYKHNVFVLL